MKTRVTFTLLFTILGIFFSAVSLYILGLVLSFSFSALNYLVSVFSNYTKALSDYVSIVAVNGIFGAIFIITFIIAVLTAAFYGYRYGVNVERAKKYKDEQLTLLLTISIFSLLLTLTIGYGFMSSAFKSVEEQCDQIKDLGTIKESKIIAIKDSIVNQDRFGEKGYTKITFTIDSVCAGEFIVDANLYSEDGIFVESLHSEDFLKSGKNDVDLTFDLEGESDILGSGTPTLEEITLSGKYLSGLTDRVETTIIDTRQVYTLSGYSESETRQDLLEILDIVDYGIDSDGDGFFEDLAIEMEVRATSSRDYKILFRMDTGLQAKETAVSLQRGESRIVLHINGANIYRSSADGPYTVKEASFQSQSNPEVRFVVASLLGYKTKEYGYRQFE